jgi:MFS family permease
MTETIPEAAKKVQRIYLLLTLLLTLAASFIWGINTLFLLDAGLSNAQAFGANALFTLGEVVFEVPTGVVADIWGRRRSYLLGTATLLVSTLLYLLMWRTRAPFWGWALASVLLGMGFTFFSGATEAWLVDALAATGFTGKLETVMARGQIASGIAMLAGTVGGGVLAQVTNVGVPYVLRSALLGVLFVTAFVLMKDLGFTPAPASTASAWAEVRLVVRHSLDQGWRDPPVRWLMLAAPFSAGVSVYTFYALQPYLLRLYGDQRAFGVAGLAAALIAGTQIVSGFLAPFVQRLFGRRTTALLVATVANCASLALLGVTRNFWVALAEVVLVALTWFVAQPLRQAYLNGIIPSAQRATVLSFDNLMASAGGVVFQPVLGRAADVWGYAPTFWMGAIIQIAAMPFLVLARREGAAADMAADE